MRSLFIAAALLASTAAVAAPNLVPNGDFEAGNSGFTTEYTLNTVTGVPEGVYDVRTSPFPYHPSWLDFGDHTTGSGLFMIANGEEMLNSIVWQSAAPIAITTNTNYFFEAFLSNVCCNPTFSGPNSDPILNFFVSLDGGAEQLLGTRTIPAGQAGIWFGLSTSFDSGAATSAVLTLRNANNAASGNDFGLDDVTLSEQSVVTPAPAAIALFGFGLVGLSLARRRG